MTNDPYHIISAHDTHTWASEWAQDSSWQLPDAGAGLQDVEVLEDVGEGHQAQRSQEPQTNPGPRSDMNSFVLLIQK